MILAIETSCDDTCAAVLDGPRVRSNVVSSQARLHARFGGIVPEVASRRHLELINPVVDAALLDAGSEKELPGRRQRPHIQIERGASDQTGGVVAPDHRDFVQIGRQRREHRVRFASASLTRNFHVRKRFVIGGR